MRIGPRYHGNKAQQYQNIKRDSDSPELAAATADNSDALLHEFSEIVDEIASQFKTNLGLESLSTISEGMNIEPTRLEVVAAGIHINKVKDEKKAVAESKNLEDGQDQGIAQAPEEEVKGPTAETPTTIQSSTPEETKSEFAKKALKGSDKEQDQTGEDVSRETTEGDNKALSPKPDATTASSQMKGRDTTNAPEGEWMNTESSPHVKDAITASIESDLSIADTVVKKNDAELQASKLEEQAIQQSANESSMVESIKALFEVDPKALSNSLLRPSLEQELLRMTLSPGKNGDVAAIARENEAVKPLQSIPTQQSNGFEGGAGRKLNASARHEESHASRGLPRTLSAKTLERVESALSEASRSRDGKTISLRLDPPNLGKLKVDVSLREGTLHARIVAESGQVNELLREKAHELQALLRKLNIDVDQVRVSIRSEDDFKNFDASQFHQQSNKTGGERSGSSNDSTEASHSSPTRHNLVQYDHWVA